jgi:hypothetical protein
MKRVVIGILGTMLAGGFRTYQAMRHLDRCQVMSPGGALGLSDANHRLSAAASTIFS